MRNLQQRIRNCSFEHNIKMRPALGEEDENNLGEWYELVNYDTKEHSKIVEAPNMLEENMIGIVGRFSKRIHLSIGGRERGQRMH